MGHTLYQAAQQPHRHIADDEHQHIGQRTVHHVGHTSVRYKLRQRSAGQTAEQHCEEHRAQRTGLHDDTAPPAIGQRTGGHQ